MEQSLQDLSDVSCSVILGFIVMFIGTASIATSLLTNIYFDFIMNLLIGLY